MSLRAVLITILLLPNICFSKGFDWENEGELVWQIVHGVDWIQTMDIVRKSDRYYETNPYLGKHPSAAEVNRYMFASAVLHFLTTKYVIPSQHVAEWQLLSISLSGFAVGNNFHIGLNFKLEM